MPLSTEQLAALLERHAMPLQLWASRRCAAADDAVQEAFCRLAALHPPPQQPVAWLYRVVRNLAENDRLSSERRRRREQHFAASEVLHDDPDAHLQADEAAAAVHRLDDRLREVLVARIWGQLTFEEIADLCGISIATASRRYRAALESLRSQLRAPCPNTRQSTTRN